MKYNVLSIDCPWMFNDKLDMSDVARGADSQYKTLSFEDLKSLKIKEISADDAICASWVPSSLLSEGLELLSVWGFRQVGTVVWVKSKKDPFSDLKAQLKKNPEKSLEILDSFDFNNSLSFGMGRTFRQCHEIALIGVKGKIYQHLKNKSQRSVFYFKNEKHSKKPEILQDRLDLMFPDLSNKIELFARRIRPGWTCLGNEIDGKDIRDAIEELL